MLARILQLFAILILLTPSSSRAGTVIKFDDLGNFAAIPNGYNGLNWSNFFALDSILYGPSGYANGVVSMKNVAYNGNAQPATISSATPFDLTSGYFTGAWNDGLSIVATGYVNGMQVASKTFQVNTSGPTLQAFDFIGINSVTFVSFGGIHNPAYASNGLHFVMDNLTISRDVLPVPEPSTLVMSGIAVLAGLGTYARRRKSA